MSDGECTGHVSPEWGITDKYLDTSMADLIVSQEWFPLDVPEQDPIRAQQANRAQRANVLRHIADTLRQRELPETRRSMLELLAAGVIAEDIVSLWMDEGIAPDGTPELKAMMRGYPNLSQQTLALSAKYDQIGAETEELQELFRQKLDEFNSLYEQDLDQ